MFVDILRFFFKDADSSDETIIERVHHQVTLKMMVSASKNTVLLLIRPEHGKI